MSAALDLAMEAERNAEVPIGAVLVSAGQIVGQGFNSPIRLNDPTAHAEMLAIRDAAGRARNYRLPGSTLYSTLEPCVMCAGAIVNARVGRLVFGARDPRFGGVRSKFQLADSPLLNHRVQIEEGIFGAQCTSLLIDFFETHR